MSHGVLCNLKKQKNNNNNSLKVSAVPWCNSRLALVTSNSSVKLKSSFLCSFHKEVRNSCHWSLISIHQSTVTQQFLNHWSCVTHHQSHVTKLFLCCLQGKDVLGMIVYAQVQQDDKILQPYWVINLSHTFIA